MPEELRIVTNAILVGALIQAGKLKPGDTVATIRKTLAPFAEAIEPARAITPACPPQSIPH